MDQVILVTGASAGIGRACADRMHHQGWKVVGASRRGTSSGGWDPMVMDVDTDTSVRSGFETLLAQHGRLDAVVACAGWGLAGAVEQTPIADARDQLETNFWGAVRVLISSIGGIIGIPFQAFYSASKFAMEGYAESLAYEVEPFNIQVTLVEPGNVRTDFTSSRRDVKAPDGDDPYAAAVARAVAKMARDEAHGITPDEAAATVQRALEARHPRRRVSVGKPGERVGIISKRLMPYRLFEVAAKGSLGV